MSKGYMSIHHQGYEGPKDVLFKTYWWGKAPQAFITKGQVNYIAQAAPHLEAPNVLPIGLICSARLP